MGANGDFYQADAASFGGTVAVTGALTTSADVTLGNAATDLVTANGDLTVEDVATFNGNAIFGNATTDTVDINGDLTVDDVVALNGNTTFEYEALLDALEQRGYTIVPFGKSADITIINTCTFTQRADFQSRQMVRRASRSNPNALIIVTGCSPQVEPDTFIKMKGVGYLLGNGEKNQIPDFLPLMQKGEFPRVRVGDIHKDTLFSEIPFHSFHRHTRAFLKIQDGCNAYCSFCIVPRARGRSRSLQPERVVENLKALKEKGFKEVVRSSQAMLIASSLK